mmetsp:Transcript_28047/g.46173  ORF Transcript_28047/g.46173 Transcript_28047/m.46173 type:complete len:373 (-) Transcript_28047:226-1344(-)
MALHVRALHARAEERASKGAEGVAGGVAHHLGQVLVEPLHVVAVLDGQHQVQQVRVAAHQALAVLDQGARQNVSALHRDGDGDSLVGRGQEVGGAVADAGAAHNVHAVVDADAHAICHLLLHDGRDHGGLLVLVDHGVHQTLGGRHDVRVPGDARQRLLHALQLGNGHLELLAHARIGAHVRDAALPRGHAQGGQRDGPALGQAVHEHVPAVARAVLPAQQLLHGNKHVLALHRAVHERGAQRVVAIAHAQARVVALQQGNADALAAHALQQALGVLHHKGQPHHAGNRRQGDVALLESGAHAQHAVPLLHHAGVAHAGGVAARRRARQPKAGDQLALGQPRQEVVLLLLRAVPHQQLAGAQRVRHHHAHGR